MDEWALEGGLEADLEEKIGDLGELVTGLKSTTQRPRGQTQELPSKTSPQDWAGGTAHWFRTLP